MTQEIDIYRTANLIIKQFGENALLEAEDRAERHGAFGEAEAASVWQRVAKAIEWMQMPGHLAEGSMQ